MSRVRPIVLAGLVLVTVALVGGAFWTARQPGPAGAPASSSTTARATSPVSSAAAPAIASDIKPAGSLMVFDFLPGIADDVEAASLAGVSAATLPQQAPAVWLILAG